MLKAQSPQVGSRCETIGALTASSLGTTVTGGAAAYGSWATLGTTTVPFEKVTIYIAKSSAAMDHLVDLGIDDGSGNVFVLAEALRFDSLRAAGLGSAVYDLPLRVPRGARLRARAYNTSGAGSVRVSVMGCSNGLGGAPGYSRCIALYTKNGTTARGPAIDPGATINTKGTIIEMVASTALPVQAVMPVIGCNADIGRTAAGALLLDVGVGSSTNEWWHLTDMAFGYETIADGPICRSLGVFPWQIPSGSRIAARCQNSDNTAGDRTIDLALYGFVA